MTNQEYEAACVMATKCYDRFEGEHLLTQCDKAIAVLEESLARLHAERREIVNRYNLNKCEHIWHFYSDTEHSACVKCGVSYDHQSN